MKIHFASELPWQCFCRGWQDFVLRASAFTWATLAKTSMRSKLVRLLALLHISPRIRSIMCIIQFKILKDHQYTFKVRHHPLFVAVYVIIITIHFTYMKNKISCTRKICFTKLVVINLAISRVVFLQAAKLLQFKSLRKFRAD